LGKRDAWSQALDGQQAGVIHDRGQQAQRQKRKVLLWDKKDDCSTLSGKLEGRHTRKGCTKRILLGDHLKTCEGGQGSASVWGISKRTGGKGGGEQSPEQQNRAKNDAKGALGPGGNPVGGLGGKKNSGKEGNWGPRKNWRVNKVDRIMGK